MNRINSTFMYSTPSECFVFNDSNSKNNDVLAMLPALLQRQGVDPALLTMLNRREGGFSDLLYLIVVLAIFGGGNFGGGLFGNRGGGCVVPNMINNDANTQLLMQTLQRNGLDIQALAGFKIRVRKNPPGGDKAYTRYWADKHGNILGKIGDPELETKLLSGNK